jgi:hypothetical protein
MTKAPDAGFTIRDLINAGDYARQGVNADQIRILLLYTPDDWVARLRADGERMYDSITLGATQGIAEVAKALHVSAISGRDSGAARFSLERRARGWWLPPSAAAGPTVTIHTRPLVQLDMADIDRRFARQTAILDGRAIDVEQEGAAGLVPFAGAGERRISASDLEVKKAGVG